MHSFPKHILSLALSIAVLSAFSFSFAATPSYTIISTPTNVTISGPNASHTFAMPTIEGADSSSSISSPFPEKESPIVKAKEIINCDIPSGITSSLGVEVGMKEVEFPDAQPYIDENNRTMIPVRAVMDSLWAEVSWAAATQTVVISKDSTEIVIPIGSKQITVTKDGITSSVTMDTNAVIKNDRTYLPIRYIAEALDMVVSFTHNYAQAFYADGTTSEGYFSDIVINEKSSFTREDFYEALTHSQATDIFSGFFGAIIQLTPGLEEVFKD